MRKKVRTFSKVSDNPKQHYEEERADVNMGNGGIEMWPLGKKGKHRNSNSQVVFSQLDKEILERIQSGKTEKQLEAHYI